MTQNSQIDGVILAGGQARRMNGTPKHRLQLQGKTLLQHVIENASQQVDQLLLSFNGKADDVCLNSGLPILSDSLPGHLGPLAGVLSALEWCQHNSSAQWLASFAVDTPLFPRDLVATLAQHRSNQQIICPRYGDFRQPTFCLWKVDQAAALRDWLQREKMYRMGAWLQQRSTQMVDIDRCTHELDPFTNINTVDELQQLEATLTPLSPDDQ